MLGLLIDYRIDLHENMIVGCSRLLIVIRSEDLVLRYFGVLHTIESGHCAQYKNLSSRQHAPHPLR